MPAFTVLRIQKLKTMGAIAGTDKHNARERETPNADLERSQENSLLFGTPEGTAHDAIKEALASQKVRKNAVLAVEMLLSASPEYFRPGKPDQAGAYEKEKLEAWAQASKEWLQERYGQRIKKATLHLDEATPHIHVVLLPLDNRGKLNCRALFGGSRHTLTELQTDYAKSVAHLGIERGITNSRATHQKVSQFYTLTQAVSPPDLPLPSAYEAPEMPNKITRMSDERLIQYASQAATNGATAQAKTLEPLLAATHNENAMLKRENLNLKKANSRLAKEKTALQKQMDQVRGLNLGVVLNHLFKAKGPYVTAPDQPHRYILPDKRDVFVQEASWHIPSVKKGKGAIDLVKAVRGYGQEELSKAIAELAHAFGEEKVTGECAAQAIGRAAETVKAAVKTFSPAQSESLGRGRSASR